MINSMTAHAGMGHRLRENMDIAEKSDSYWMVSNKDVDGKQLNEDGI